MIAALAAVAIGVAAIVVAVVQVGIMREEQHASVWPRLVIGSGYSPGQRLEFIVLNKGIGPAVVKSVRAAVGGRAVASWPAAFEAMTGERRPWRGSMSSIRRGLILSPGESVTAFRLTDSALVDGLVRRMDALSFEICYCSVYDRCWITTTEETAPEPRPARTCTASPAEFR